MLARQQADRSGNTLNRAVDYFEQTKNGTETGTETETTTGTETLNICGDLKADFISLYLPFL